MRLVGSEMRVSLELEREVKEMSAFVNGYYIEYIVGHTYCTVTSGSVDEFGRFIGKEMVFRSESWDECLEYANSH